MRTPSATLIAAGVGVAAIGLALAGTASAGPSCTSTTPAVGDTVTCSYSTSGGTTITVPVGTGSILVTAMGGGGGGGSRSAGSGYPAGSAGGAGAKVVALLDRQALGTVTATVGAGGSGSPWMTTWGGTGGGYSALYAGSADTPSQALAVAGGGGGGASTSQQSPSVIFYPGGAGAAGQTAAGGDGGNLTSARGLGGSGGTGGAQVSCGNSTQSGSSWASGGAGGTTTSAGGYGGAGYGGGSSGCGRGGGAGGSMTADAYRLGDATYSPEGGAGGAGGTASSPNTGDGGNGGHGQMTVQFIVASFALTYQGNGATGGAVPGDSGTSWIYDAAVTLPGNTGGLERAGHAFAGWNTAADGSGTAYAPGATITMRQALTLYARWTPVAAAPSQGAQPTSGPTTTVLPTRLAARFALAQRVGTTTGAVPAGATRITQVAIPGVAAALGLDEMASARAVTGKCRITTVRNKKTKKVTKRTYKCTIRLAKGTWTVTTTARGKAGVVAEGSRRVVVK